MIAILVVAAGASAITAMRLAIKSKEVTVPALVGKTEDEAKNLADKNKLALERQKDEPSTPEKKGKVIKQDPLKDQPIPADRKIKVTFGTG